MIGFKLSDVGKVCSCGDDCENCIEGTGARIESLLVYEGGKVTEKGETGDVAAEVEDDRFNRWRLLIILTKHPFSALSSKP